MIVLKLCRGTKTVRNCAFQEFMSLPSRDQNVSNMAARVEIFDMMTPRSLIQWTVGKTLPFESRGPYDANFPSKLFDLHSSILFCILFSSAHSVK